MTAASSPFADPRRDGAVATVTASYAHGPTLTVLDGHGGALALDLASDDLRWLADACRRLLRGSVPLGASALKVRAAEKCYLISRRPPAHEPEAAWNVTIANLYDSGESVTLASDLAELLAAMIDEAVLRREHSHLVEH